MKLNRTFGSPIQGSLPLAPLPALRSLGDLADVRPVIVIDTREQTPLTFQRLQAVPGTLTTGDYSFRGGEHLFAVERKSIADLTGCCVGESRERFERELHRLRGFRFKRLLVVGTREQVEAHEYQSGVSPAAVFGTLAAFEVRYDCPVVWKDDPTEAAAQVELWVWWFAKELVENVNDLKRGCVVNA